MAWMKWRGTPEKGSWNAIWKEPAPELKAGRRQRYRSLSRDEGEARKMLAELNRNLERGAVGLGQIVTIPELKQRHLKHLKSKNCAAATIERVGIVLDHLNALFPKLKLPQLDADRLDLYKEKRLAAGIAPSTVNREVGIIKDAVRKGRRWQYQIQDLSDVEKLQADKPSKIAYPGDEMEAMLAVGDAIDRLTVLLGGYVGLRRSELLRARPENYKPQEHKIELGVRRRREASWRAKGGKSRAVPLHRRAERHLRFWLRRLPAGAERIIPWDATPQAFTGRFARLRARAGLEHGTIHELRHSYVTALKRGNVEGSKVQRMAGHEKGTTTDVYTHLDVSDMHEDAQRLKY